MAILTCLLSIATTVLIGVLGYSGYNSTSSITITACTDTYFFSKFGSLDLIQKISFFHSLIATVFSIVLLVVMILLLKKIKTPELVKIKSTHKVILYLSASILVYMSIIPAGHFLTFQVQLDHCTSAYITSKVLTIAIISTLTVCFSFVNWLLLFGLYWRVSENTGEKYKEVVQSQT